MDHYIVGPNHLRHYVTKVQDNPMSDDPLSIITQDNEFCMEIDMEGTIMYDETNSPTDNVLTNMPSHYFIITTQLESKCSSVPTNQ